MRSDEFMEQWRDLPKGSDIHAQLLQETHPVRERVMELLCFKRADQLLDAHARASVQAARTKRTMRERVALPQAPQVIEGVLAAEVNLLGGPSEAGKSLLARDWALHIAAGVPWRGYAVPERRNVLWVASEGMHDTEIRWASQPLWDLAADRVFDLDAIALTNEQEVDWLIKEYIPERPGLVVFDVIYGMGMADDTGTKDTIPVISAMKRISAEWGAATLALGHPGHNGERRFRGSSMWRQLAYTEWHLADNLLTCEKSKIADKAQLRADCATEYPGLRWLSKDEARSRRDGNGILIALDVEEHPRDSVSARARRLAPALGVGESRARHLIGEVVRGVL